MGVLFNNSISFPGTTELTISLWFKLTNLNSFLPNSPTGTLSDYGAGAYSGGGGSLPNWNNATFLGGDLYPQTLEFGNPFAVADAHGNKPFSNVFPLIEWGDQNIDVGSGAFASSNSGIYVTPAKQIIFLNGGKFYPLPSPLTPPTPPMFFNGWFTSQMLVANASELSSSGWNHLFVAADLSSPDQWPVPYNEVDGDPTNHNLTTNPMNLTQNSRISIVCNNLMHTAGFCHQVLAIGSGSDTYSPGGNGIFTPSEPGDAQYLTHAPIVKSDGTVFLYNSAGDTNPNTQIFEGEGFGLPCLSGNAVAGYNYPNIAYAYAQIWFGTYIDPAGSTAGKGNLSYFFTPKIIAGRGRVLVPPTDVNAAQNAFGPSDLYFYRSKASRVQFQTNRGTAGDIFSVLGPGTAPTDYSPGPG